LLGHDSIQMRGNSTLFRDRWQLDDEIFKPCDRERAIAYCRARSCFADQAHPSLTQEEPPSPVGIEAVVDRRVREEPMRPDGPPVCLGRERDRTFPCLDVAQYEVRVPNFEEAVVAKLGTGSWFPVEDAFAEGVDANEAILGDRIHGDLASLQAQHIPDPYVLDRGHVVTST
jgi:hypothetical protein